MDSLKPEEITNDMLSFVLETGVVPATNRLYIIEFIYIVLLYGMYFFDISKEWTLLISVGYNIFRIDKLVNFINILSHYHRMILIKIK